MTILNLYYPSRGDDAIISLTSMLFYITALALLFLSVGCTVAAEDFIKAASPMVHLPYATYTGFHNTTSSLDVFLGIRYAAPPTGNNRW